MQTDGVEVHLWIWWLEQNYLRPKQQGKLWWMRDSWQAQDHLKEKTFAGAHGTGRRSGGLAVGIANE